MHGYPAIAKSGLIPSFLLQTPRGFVVRGCFVDECLLDERDSLGENINKWARCDGQDPSLGEVNGGFRIIFNHRAISNE